MGGAAAAVARAARAAVAPRVYASIPNGGRGAAATVAGAFAVYMVAAGSQYTTGVFYKAWLRAPAFAGASPSSLAWATSLEAASFLGGSLAGGRMVLRLGVRATVLAGGALMLAGSLAAGVAGSLSGPAALVLLYAFFGVTLGTGCALVAVAAIVSVQPYFTTRRGLATGVTVAGSGIGGFILGPALEALIAARGWEAALAIFGGASALVCCAAVLVLRPIVIVAAAAGGKEEEDDEGAPEVAAAVGVVGDGDGGVPPPPPPLPPRLRPAPPPPPPPISLRALFRVPFFTTYCAFVCLFAVCWFTAPTFMPVYVAEELGGSSMDVGGVVAVQGIANTVGRVVLGLAADAFPARKLAILSACIASVAVATLGLAVAHSLPFAYVYAATLGGLGGSIVSLQPALIIDAVGLHALPLAQGAFNAVQAPFALFGPPIGGALRSATGNYSFTWSFLCAVFTAAAVLTRGIEPGWVDLRACLARSSARVRLAEEAEAGGRAGAGAVVGVDKAGGEEGIAPSVAAAAAAAAADASVGGGVAAAAAFVRVGAGDVGLRGGGDDVVGLGPDSDDEESDGSDGGEGAVTARGRTLSSVSRRVRSSSRVLIPVAAVAAEQQAGEAAGEERPRRSGSLRR